ncbi:MAG TPA: single-stranded DNA-binding protein [Pseudonocardia sp.]|nr:single-stranded DNA-binding protein [Pseudonocardia sp.]
MNETEVTVVGNVISDVKSRRTGEGIRVVNFRVASNERRFDKGTGEWVDGDRFFVSVTCWRKLAAGVVASLSKGDPVVVTGRLYTRGYEVEGQRRSVTEIEASAVGPDLSRCSAELTRVRRSATEDAPITVSSEDGTVVPSQSTGPEMESERPALEVVGGSQS